MSSSEASEMIPSEASEDMYRKYPKKEEPTASPQRVDLHQDPPPPPIDAVHPSGEMPKPEDVPSTTRDTTPRPPNRVIADHTSQEEASPSQVVIETKATKEEASSSKVVIETKATKEEASSSKVVIETKATKEEASPSKKRTARNLHNIPRSVKNKADGGGKKKPVNKEKRVVKNEAKKREMKNEAKKGKKTEPVVNEVSKDRQDRNEMTFTIPLRKENYKDKCIFCDDMKSVNKKKKKNVSITADMATSMNEPEEMDVPVTNEEGEDNGVEDGTEKVVETPRRKEQQNSIFVTCAIPGCGQQMHRRCAKEFRCSEYNAVEAKHLFHVDGPVCPAHICWHCFDERYKNSAWQGDFADCEKCIRSFHKECRPAGTQITSSHGKRETFVCHIHGTKLPITSSMRLKLCLECDELVPRENENGNSEDDGNQRMECKSCTNVFHKKCSYKVVKGRDSDTYEHDVCTHCIIGSSIVVGQRVIAYYRHNYQGLGKGYFPAIAVALAAVPPFAKNKLGRNFGKTGFIPVQWIWNGAVGDFYDLIPHSQVQRMTLKSDKNMLNANFKQETMIAKKDCKAPTRPLDNDAMKKTVKIVRVNSYMQGTLNRIKEKTPHISECICKPDSDGIKCNTGGCLNRNVHLECPESCDEKDGVTCANRGLQRTEEEQALLPDKYKLDVAPNGKGFGIFATDTIKPMEFIFEYCGEVIDKAEKERREERLRVLATFDEWTYLMGLKRGFFVDARWIGGLARYCNHSCDPNAVVETIDVPIKKLGAGTYEVVPRLKLTALKKINPGDEITFDYEIQESNGLSVDECRCGAKKCKGQIGGKKNGRIDWRRVLKMENIEDGEMNEEGEKENEEKSKKRKQSTGQKKTMDNRRLSTGATTPKRRREEDDE